MKKTKKKQKTEWVRLGVFPLIHKADGSVSVVIPDIAKHNEEMLKAQRQKSQTRRKEQDNETRQTIN